MSVHKRPLYAALASLIKAQDNCRKNGNSEWETRHGESIGQLVDMLPSGSGIDNGIVIDDSSTSEKLVFHFGYHHMDDVGYHDGWTEHTLTVKPSLQFGIDLRISGPNRNDLKEYLYDLFGYALKMDVWQEETAPFAYVCSHRSAVPETIY